eukprot:12756924-Alexandrium_andersonii.AAC.1
MPGCRAGGPPDGRPVGQVADRQPARCPAGVPGCRPIRMPQEGWIARSSSLARAIQMRSHRVR